MKNDKFKQILHFFAGAVLLPTAFKLFESKKFTYSVILLLAGISFLLVSASLDFLEKKIGNIIKLAFLAEAVILLFAGYIQLSLSKKMPAIAFATAGFLYFLFFCIIYMIKTNIRNTTRSIIATNIIIGIILLNQKKM